MTTEFMSFCITVALMVTFIIEYVIAGSMSPLRTDVLFESNYIVVTPSRLYECTKKFNIFGCWVICILFRIVNPIGTIGKLIHFIFTTGRRS